jgi:glycosyltransferase involved in cell wall biosynthesis
MKVIAFTRYGRLGASSRVRLAQYVDTLAAAGLDVRLRPLLDDDYLKDKYAGRPTNRIRLLKSYLARIAEVMAAAKHDLIWIEKELFPGLPALAERWLASRGVRYVVDYDDATFHYYDLGGSWLKRRLADKIDQVMRHAALVVAGNGYIADRARRAGAGRVEIVPTVVDLDRYRQKRWSEDGPIVVGWMGTPPTVKYLDAVAEAVECVAREVPVQLRVVGAQFARKGLAVDCRRWSESTEADEIGQFDIGIMPLSDTPWERGKCGYKLIQYMACGVPVIGSPVGVNSEIIADGLNGYLASTTADWTAALRRLCSDRALRQRMGDEGRRIVEARYSLQGTAPRLAKLLAEIASKRLPGG